MIAASTRSSISPDAPPVRGRYDSLTEAGLTTIVSLANSRDTLAGRCLAGFEGSEGGLGGRVRLANARAAHKRSGQERCSRNGDESAIHELSEILRVRTAPWDFLQENHLVDAAFCRVYRGSLPWDRLSAAVEYPTGSLRLDGVFGFSSQDTRVP
ncbi:MAG: hypothetical protein U0556_10400 [Dehalococcoidia bacterium]